MTLVGSKGLFLYPAGRWVIEMEGTMPRYRNKENGNELDATEEFAAVALPDSLYEQIADETSDERLARELSEARDAKVEPADAENDYQGQHDAPGDPGDIVTPEQGDSAENPPPPAPIPPADQAANQDGV